MEHETVVAILGGLFHFLLDLICMYCLAGMYGTALATVASYEKKNKVILFTIEEDCVKMHFLSS